MCTVVVMDEKYTWMLTITPSDTLKTQFCVSAGSWGGEWPGKGEILSPREWPPHLSECVYAVEEQQLLQHLVQRPLHPHQGHAQGQTLTAPAVLSDPSGHGGKPVRSYLNSIKMWKLVLYLNVCIIWFRSWKAYAVCCWITLNVVLISLQIWQLLIIPSEIFDLRHLTAVICFPLIQLIASQWFCAGAWGALPVKGHHGAAEDEPDFLWVRLGHHQKVHLCCLLPPGCEAQGTSCSLGSPHFICYA